MSVASLPTGEDMAHSGAVYSDGVEVVRCGAEVLCCGATSSNGAEVVRCGATSSDGALACAVKQLARVTMVVLAWAKTSWADGLRD